MTLVARFNEAFTRHFGGEATHFAQAPGRVNLIGEHTDYNDGFVMPCAVQFGTMVAARPRTDGTISVVALDYGEQQSTFASAREIPTDTDAPWSNYIRGVVWGLKNHNCDVGGVDLVVSGTVPREAGLSSSASLEVATLTLLNELNGLGLTSDKVAWMGQHVENEYVGCSCGIMDQLISAQGQQDHALLIDCRSLETQPVVIPSDLAVVVINSNVKRGLVGSEYNLRREQCQAAADALGVTALRDATMAQLDAARAQIDDVTYRRARHVITENTRTLAAAEALRANDLPRLAQLMAESHLSLKHDFEVTVPPVDALVQLTDDILAGRGGVRMTGGGFGGCIVALATHEAASDLADQVGPRYTEQTGLNADVYVCRAEAGASILS